MRTTTLLLGLLIAAALAAAGALQACASDVSGGTCVPADGGAEGGTCEIVQTGPSGPTGPSGGGW